MESAATARKANDVALEHASAKHKELEDSLAVHASTVAALQSELANKTTEITQLKSADSAMKSQAAELEKALAKVALLEEQARADTATIAELRAENEGLRTTTGEHEKSIKELQKQLTDEAAMEQQLAELRQQLANAEEAHNAAITAATEAEEKVGCTCTCHSSGLCSLNFFIAVSSGRAASRGVAGGAPGLEGQHSRVRPRPAVPDTRAQAARVKPSPVPFRPH